MKSRNDSKRPRFRPVAERLDARCLLAAGALDPTFGVGGIVRGPALEYPQFSSANAVAVQPDGKIVALGDDNQGITVTRLNPDGSPDAGFGTGGVVQTDLPFFRDNISLSIQDDRKIVVAGNHLFPANESRQDFGIVRLDADGSMDTDPTSGFGPHSDPSNPSSPRTGFVETTFSSYGNDTTFKFYSEAFLGMVTQANHDVVVCGRANGDGVEPGTFLARFTPDGTLDRSFGSGGTGLVFLGQEENPGDLMIDPGGKILLGEYVHEAVPVTDGLGSQDVVDQYHLAVRRFSGAGVPDTTFGPNHDGLVSVPLPGRTASIVPSEYLAAMTVDAQGRIVLAGPYSNYDDTLGYSPDGGGVTARLNADGGLDGTFGSGGVLMRPGESLNNFVATTFQPDGKLVSVTSAGYSVSNTIVVARFNPDLSPDASFGAGGQVVTPLSATSYGSPKAIAIQADGAILVTGSVDATFVFLRYQGRQAVDPATVATQLQGVVATLQQAGAGQSVTLQATTQVQVDAAINAVSGLSVDATKPVTVVLDGGGQSYKDTRVAPPAGVTLVFRDLTFIGGSPALIVDSGTVLLDGVTASNNTDAPTILVRGGSLVIRRSTIQESTGFARAAVQITGGVVDLGTSSDPGGNTINVNGLGLWLLNLGRGEVPVVGDAFTFNGVPIPRSSLSGLVFSDFNDDGQVDFGEQGIGGVTITLGGVDMLGNAIHATTTTDSSGAYVFSNLLPGLYTVSETQPTGYSQGTNSVGTVGGVSIGIASPDRFDLYLGAGVDALNYNYGERPAATGAVQRGQTAGIGFWNNPNGQALIKALNGGVGTQLGNWLASTFPHMFGASSAGNNLAGRSNAYVASFFQSRFILKDQKLDAQVLATALSVYVSDGVLDSTGVGTRYGFVVGGNGVATSSFNVGANGAAFGVADNKTMAVMDLLLAVDAQAVNGVLYGGNTVKRTKANNVFSNLNQVGGIS